MARTNLALATLAAVITLDVATTVVFRDLGIAESNPLMVGIVDQTWLFVGMKFGFLAVFAIPVLILKVSTINRFIYVAAGILGVAVTMNLYAIVGA